jgi:hypothetical protein
LKSDLARVDVHTVKHEEYEELPELTEEKVIELRTRRLN